MLRQAPGKSSVQSDNATRPGVMQARAAVVTTTRPRIRTKPRLCRRQESRPMCGRFRRRAYLGGRTTPMVSMRLA